MGKLVFVDKAHSISYMEDTNMVQTVPVMYRNVIEPRPGAEVVIPKLQRMWQVVDTMQTVHSWHRIGATGAMSANRRPLQAYHTSVAALSTVFWDNYEAEKFIEISCSDTVYIQENGHDHGRTNQPLTMYCSAHDYSIIEKRCQIMKGYSIFFNDKVLKEDKVAEWCAATLTGRYDIIDMGYNMNRLFVDSDEDTVHCKLKWENRPEAVA
jgi:hypothetical protein